MERLNQLVRMKEYEVTQAQIAEYEKDRIYCGHIRAHYLDVARIAYILSMEEKLNLEKELIYTTAFLHDIGRANEYRGQCSHESGSVLMTLNLLPKCGFAEEEIKLIAKAIATHRDKEKVVQGTLGDVLYRADKLSRDCFVCDAQATCKWTEEKKNYKTAY